MEASNFLIVGVGLGPNLERDNSRHIDVEVILIDKTWGREDKPPALSITEPERVDDSIVIMGAVQSLDKEKKSIVLESGDILHYQHLVVTNGAHHTYVTHGDPESYRVAMLALAQAIRLRNLVTSGLWAVTRRRENPFGLSHGKEAAVIGKGKARRLEDSDWSVRPAATGAASSEEELAATFYLQV